MHLKFIYFINVNGYQKINLFHFTELLLENIHPNPEIRNSITDTVQTFNGFLTGDIDTGVRVFKDLKKLY